MFLSKLKVLAAVVFVAAVAVVVTVTSARLALADKPPATGKEADRKDEETIVGTWAVVSVEEGGQDRGGEDLKEARMIFAADGKLTWKAGKGEKGGTYKLDRAKKPKELTITTDEGDTVKGIYKLDGDTLTICVGGKGGERPTEFATKEGSDAALLVFKRVKK